MASASLRYKQTHPFDERKAEVARVRSRTPDRIPVICERALNSSVPELDKKKYLIPPDVTVGAFIVSIRRRITIEPEKAIFLFVGDNVPSNSTLMGDLYNTYKDEDGFLYVTYSGENTYGRQND